MRQRFTRKSAGEGEQAIAGIACQTLLPSQTQKRYAGGTVCELHVVVMLRKAALDGGGRGIRTLETVARLHAFQACAFDHSAIPPARLPFSDAAP